MKKASPVPGVVTFLLVDIRSAVWGDRPPPHMGETPGHSWIINQEPLGILGNNKVVSSRDEVATFARAITIYDVVSGPAQEES